MDEFEMWFNSQLGIETVKAEPVKEIDPGYPTVRDGGECLNTRQPESPEKAFNDWFKKQPINQYNPNASGLWII